ncbi:Protein of unknown function [Cupriavidus sp. YR651]|nr:DUF2474 domain-containing protein [Cupriavidus sp. YR651]SDD47525.1 Protein of unknown function [Cupriavidus sp. YR651]
MQMTPRHVPRWLRRLGWLVLIWAGSVVALGVAAWVLRGVMQLAGMHR